MFKAESGLDSLLVPTRDEMLLLCSWQWMGLDDVLRDVNGGLIMRRPMGSETTTYVVDAKPRCSSSCRIVLHGS